MDGSFSVSGLISVVQQIFQSQITFGTSGNVSERDDDRDGFWITPSGVSWRDIADESLVKITAGAVTGNLRPSTEWRAHQALYERHPWIGGVVHLHSPYATILSVVGSPVKAVHYQMARVADEVPVLPYTTFGTNELAQSVAQALSPQVRAALVANHGLFAVGDSVQSAWTAAREVEWTAMIQYHAMLIAAPAVLSPGQLQAVRDAMAHYGQAPTP
ncbi:MAG: class II aldolase family protein [Sulfobacillus acidophilus]|uniref:Class II aldolase family protein n=1 Tax=Sulfobacillus acidophilus TaxID=53633 RepID=A0A2T2WD26_9FIRM|nr:MAG: class II aldolase family protein [Sulfobacillus acidophilus]